LQDLTPQASKLVTSSWKVPGREAGWIWQIRDVIGSIAGLSSKIGLEPTKPSGMERTAEKRSRDAIFKQRISVGHKRFDLFRRSERRAKQFAHSTPEMDNGYRLSTRTRTWVMN
jgi:hypothetical protein